MKITLGKFTVTLHEGQSCSLKDVQESEGVTKTVFHFNWTEENAANDDGFSVYWTEAVAGVMYKWDSRCMSARELTAHWDDRFSSMLSRLSPVTCYFDGLGRNRYCWALSECKHPVELLNKMNDQSGRLGLQFSFGTRQFTRRYETEITLLTDVHDVPMREAVTDVAAWWETLGMKPMPVPDDAREPLYSFWYSYHQEVNEADVEAECRRAKEMGFRLCIVDDGWQTEDISGGYAYCGDWKPAPGKFPTMAAHIRRVHELGMKYLLWYSVPLIGERSEHYREFQGKLLRSRPSLKAAILDPRYPDTRAFLVETFRRALTEWDLDGFKLDFIDTWTDDPANAPYNDKMDIPALQDAVDVCMTEITTTLLAIKPDLLIEFRQNYIGPHLKRFGNIFRVGDCAGNYTRNRVAILDLRMLTGPAAVHSDMLMLAPFEDPRVNALQMISCMFGVMQYSGRLDRLDDAMLKTSRFWLAFFKEHRDLLQTGTLTAYEPHLLYTWVKSTLANACAVGVYAIDKCVRPDPADTIYIANGCMGERVLVELTGTYHVRVLTCCGDEADSYDKTFDGVTASAVPVGGLLVLTRKN